jgi:hypothetical protein
MTLAPTEFIRRFLLHILPTGFQRIRYYGVLGNRHRATKLAQCRHLLGMPAPTPLTSVDAPDHRDRVEALTGISLRRCPMCHDGHMMPIDVAAGPSTCPANVNTS